MTDGSASRQGSSTSNASSGVKRKRGSELKFYAVRIGRVPGVYHTWAECLNQVKGFKNATFKSFTSLTDAEAFAQGHATSAPSGPPKFYAVANGRNPGVYNDWPSALAQIKGWSKPSHRSFSSRAEAEAFVRNAAKSTANAEQTADDADITTSGLMGSPPLKKGKQPSVLTASDGFFDALGWDPLPPDAEDGFDNRITLDLNTGKLRYKSAQELEAMVFQSTVDPSADVLEIWTDGACRSNGQAGAIAGVGVFFGRNDPRNVSEALPGTRQTNQRAELTAIKRALDVSPLNRSVRIYSDSNYSIQCVTTWCKTWIRNGWVNAAKKPVENKDLIEEILGQIKERDAAGVTTTFIWVKGHSHDAGNVAADELAVKGALDAKVGGQGSA